jgi:hypothetical protein
VAKTVDFRAELDGTRHARQRVSQVDWVDWFHQVVACAATKCFDRALDRSVARDDDDFRRAVGRQLAQQIDSIAVRQYQIEQHDVRVVLQLFAGDSKRGRGRGRESLVGDHFRQRGTVVLVVVNNERVGHGFGAAR